MHKMKRIGQKQPFATGKDESLALREVVRDMAIGLIAVLIAALPLLLLLFFLCGCACIYEQTPQRDCPLSMSIEPKVISAMVPNV